MTRYVNRFAKFSCDAPCYNGKIDGKRTDQCDFPTPRATPGFRPCHIGHVLNPSGTERHISKVHSDSRNVASKKQKKSQTHARKPNFVIKLRVSVKSVDASPF